MHIETVGLKGNHEWYEDALVQNTSISRFGVLDGATSLQPYRGENGETGAYLAAQIVKGELESVASANRTLVEAVLHGNQILREEMERESIDIEDAASLWSCALACIQISEYSVDYVQAADCMILAKYETGEIRLLTRDQVAPIGQQSLATYMQYRQQSSYSHAEIVELIKPTLRSNRFKANKVGGYSVVNGQPQLANFLEYGAINRNGLQAIYMMSDGLFLPSSLASTPEQLWTKTIQFIDELTLTGYANWLLEEERADSNCEKYVRLKVSDDKTGIKITF